MSIVVNDIPPINQYLAGGGQTVFAFTFAILNLTDINVYLTPNGAQPNDITDILIYNVNYTVTNNVPPAVGGSITLMAGATAGDIITIVRNMPYTFTNNYINGAPLTAASLNTNFDANVMMAQQDKMYNKNIGPTYNVSALVQDGIDTLLPVLPANSIWMKNYADNAIVPVSLPPAGGSAILPTIPNVLPIFDNAAGVIKNSNMTEPFNTGQNGQPMLSNGGNPFMPFFTDSAGFIWQKLNYNVDFNLEVNTLHIVSGVPVDAALPGVASAGNRIMIVVNTDVVDGVTISQGANQTIHGPGNYTTVGIGGSLSFGSTSFYVVLTLVCVVNNTTWMVESTTATDLVWT